MDAAARLSFKGQVTVPKVVREALGVKEPERRTSSPSAGSVRVPAAKRNVAWDEVIRRTRRARAVEPQ